MNTIRFYSAKIASSINLKKVAAAYRLSMPESWDECVILEEQELIDIYKIHMPSKRIYIFSYGCIVFENFEADEMGEFLKSIPLVVGELDYQMLASYNESYTLPVEDGRIDISLSYIAAVVLAKSSALSRQESSVDLLLDEAESYIDKLQTAAFGSSTRNFSKTMARIIRFEHESAATIKLFERPAKASESLALREAYDKLSDSFELEDRYDVLEKKISELRSIVRSYAGLRNNSQEKRLLFFEIFLLTLFPLSRVLEIILHKLGMENVFKLLLSYLLQKLNIFY